MTSGEIRQAYLDFFTQSPRNHTPIDPAPLVLYDDPTTLFTSAGMQPLVPYLKGRTHPSGSKRLVNSQPSFRTQDIDEVGDNRHTTFFEMLGNWSLGDYFKDEQLPWIWEFLTKELSLPKERLFVTIFEGSDAINRDVESEKIWESLGLSSDHIIAYDASKNWWSRSGTPDAMSVDDIGGPDSEIFYDVDPDARRGIHDQSSVKDRTCHPNCPCGRFLEIGNSVFIEYVKNADGSLSELPQKNVDFGGGLERLWCAKHDEPDIFKGDLFHKTIEILEAITKTKSSYISNPNPYRIVVDHLRAAAFLVNGGVEPSNKLQGYVLRRLIRRAMVQARKLGLEGDEWLSNALPSILQPYMKVDLSLYENTSEISQIITLEVDRFRKTIDRGLREFEKLEENQLNALNAFNLYQSYGFPFEVTKELFLEKGVKLNEEEFRSAQKLHADLSRKAAVGMFKGGLVGHTETTTKYHTATHVLHQALRDVLGSHVVQKGSNITDERLRFDFSHDKPMTAEEIKRVEKIVNDTMKKDLPVTKEEMSIEDAKKAGAIGLFPERYNERVTVYSIGDYSKEICGGPHVHKTGDIGGIKITKEEAVSAGTRRIRAILTP